ncbi:Scr1 family TA system antitoxin-like transcriptional regulator [Streptomyces goshikiensis]|uniref:Scr1 family TA system antitoxin-like transcriptional regulator n=1 Tax=Streptomyces goshikiensis TaxID=1942 RepID=UPI0036835F67
MSTTEEPTVTAEQAERSPRARLALALHLARDGAGITSRELAERLGWDESKISRTLNLRRVPTTQETRAWMAACSADDAATQAAVELAEETVRSRTESGGHDAPTYAELLLRAWATASTARLYARSALPALLATDEYSATLATRGHGFTPPELADVQARLADGSVDCTVVLDDEVLYTRLVGPQGMNAQLARLVELAQHPNVQIGVISRNSPFLPPASDFSIVGRTVLTPLINGPLEQTTTYALGQHTREFAAAEQAAVFGAEATVLIAQALAATGG